MKPYYQHGGIEIYHGDCIEVMRSLPDCSVELIITDPPYSSGARRDSERSVRGASMSREIEDADWFSHDQMTTWGFTWFLRAAMIEARRLARAGSHFYVFCDWRQQPNVYGILESSGLRVNHTIVWDKVHFGMGCYWRNQHEFIVFGSAGTPTAMLRLDRGSVIQCPRERNNSDHPTEKPLALLECITEAAPGAMVLDPLMGSGTTLIAAKKLNRTAIGIEIEERYCEIAAKRLSQEVFDFGDTLSRHDTDHGGGTQEQSPASDKVANPKQQLEG